MWRESRSTSHRVMMRSPRLSNGISAGNAVLKGQQTGKITNRIQSVIQVQTVVGF